MKVVWTPKSRTRLQQIHDYIALDNPTAAKNLVATLIQQITTIADQPYAGTRVKEYQRDNIRELYNGRYRLIYRIRNNAVEVLTVRHSARQMPKQPKNL